MPSLFAVVFLGLSMLLVERLAPARDLPRVRGWWPRAILLNLLQVGAVFVAGLTWDRLLLGRGLFDLSGLGAIAGGSVVYLVSAFAYYAWHRARHEVDWLWRWMHQLHHSPTRMETAMAFYKHPFEMLANAAISSLVAYGLLGVSPEAGAFYAFLAVGAELFYHWNVRTPQWVGWFVQRPEMHRVHHMRGVHAHNYADLPVIDMLFGTYLNPATADAPIGFGDGKELAVSDMLRGQALPADAPVAFDAPPRRRRPALVQRSSALAATLLALLGMAQMIGAVTGARGLRGVGAVTNASPYPKVFTDQDGYETFSAAFVVETTRADGSTETHVLTPENYGRLRGPYNRRNVYGAALSYAPRLPRELVDQVVDYGFNEPGELRRELGLPDDMVSMQVRIESQTRGREDQSFVYDYRFDHDE